MVTLPAGSYIALLFLCHLSFFDWFMGTRKNIALSHRANAIVAAVNLAGRQRTLTDGSFSDRRVFYPGQPASDVDSNSQGMEPCSSLFAGCDLRPLREYEQYV